MKQNITKQTKQSNKQNIIIAKFKKRSSRNSANSNDSCHNTNIEYRNQLVKGNTTYIYRSQQINGHNQQQNRLSTSMTIRQTKQKIFSPWVNQNQIQKAPIKWIGVHHKNYQNSHHIKLNNFAFPKRKQKNYDQSLSNFLLKYGKTLKRCQIQKAQAKSIFRNSEDMDNCVTNAATTKVKPRIMWFEKKKPAKTCTKFQYMVTAKNSSKTFKN